MHGVLKMKKFFVDYNNLSLINNPIKLNKQKIITNFNDLNYKNDSMNYSYAISSWINIFSYPPETNKNYSKYTPILNIGNKPKILYNASKQSLLIKMKVNNETTKIIYKDDKFVMQKWNHIVVNYDRGTLDIFINNKLVSTTQEIIPYKKNDNVTSGCNNGIYGAICNTRYYGSTLSRNKISWLYNSVKESNPPIN